MYSYADKKTDMQTNSWTFEESNTLEFRELIEKEADCSWALLFVHAMFIAISYSLQCKVPCNDNGARTFFSWVAHCSS